METAMLITGFSIDDTIHSIEQGFENQVKSFADDSSGFLSFPATPANLDEAKEIYQAMIEDAYRYTLKNGAKPTLIISSMTYVTYLDASEEDLSNASFTIESIARWLYETALNRGNAEEGLSKARIICPNFVPINEVTEPDELEALTKENTELKKLLTEMRSSSKQPRESRKPFLLISQLIKIIDPNLDLSKSSQVHSALERKLIGEEKLAVSQATLKTYIENT
jgi:hypothetical protein